MASYYRAIVKDFLAESESSILGTLSDSWTKEGFRALEQKQIGAWSELIRTLKVSLESIASSSHNSLQWGVLVEFRIPRRQKRIDAVLLAGGLVFVIEYKGGQSRVDPAGILQVEDYQLDLIDFHETSRGRTVIPVLLVANEGTTPKHRPIHKEAIQFASPSSLTVVIQELYAQHKVPGEQQIEVDAWDKGTYWPVPTIIEAATALYTNANVREIAHSAAGSENLETTTEAIIGLIREAQEKKQKTICFVTGVPGSGKTLAGLNAVHHPLVRAVSDGSPVFLSGNGPLIKIVREALVQDSVLRGEERVSARRSVQTFIQNMHAFIEDHSEPHRRPHEHVIVFDEAQRAWSGDHNYRKRGIPHSEPHQVLEIMNRHPDWAVVVALVGGGQEIHNGEAGLEEWGRSLLGGFTSWTVCVSHEAVQGGVAVAGHTLFPSETGIGDRLKLMSELHLHVSVRSHRTRVWNEWVNKILVGEPSAAARLAKSENSFEVVLTRDLNQARKWLKEQTRGTRRCGLVASSGASRLRAYGIEMSSSFHRNYPFHYWFLKGETDVRSSYQLEVAASEFEVQGLELDWVGLCWDADFIWNPDSREWEQRRFVGNRWISIRDERQRNYLINKYRVLLTRARVGMVLWVPPGCDDDPTRARKPLDGVAEYLQSCGVRPLH